MPLQRRSVLQLATAAALTALAGCGGGGPEDEPQELTLTRTDFYPGEWPIGTYVVRSEEEWVAAWNAHRNTMYPPPERPTFDFDRSMLVGVALGLGCDQQSMRILRAVRLGTLTTVEYRQYPPPPGDWIPGCGDLFEFVLIPRSSGEVRFKDLT